MEKLFDTSCNLSDTYKHVGENIPYILAVEMIPLFITMENGKATDYEHYPDHPNAYGVYLRYNDEGIEKANLNPSEWLADFSTEEAATAFKQLLDFFIVDGLI